MTAEQRTQALSNANEIRLGMAAVKRELRSGEKSFEAALTDERARRVKLGDLLKSMKGVGPAKAAKVLNRSSQVSFRRVGTLSDAERDVLVAVLSRWPSVRARA